MRFVQILELIHASRAEFSAHARSECRVALQCLDGEQDEIVEIDPIAGRHQYGVSGDGGRQLLVDRSGCASLHLGDATKKLRCLALRDVQRFREPLHALRLAGDGETETEMGRVRTLAKDREAERMERMDWNLARVSGQQTLKPLAHLAGGASGEGDR